MNQTMPRMATLSAAIAAALCAGSAQAAEIATPVPDLTVRWDNTVKYSAAYRLKHPSAMQVTPGENTINTDDGDRNFGKGPVSNRADLLSELDVAYRNFGVRVSGAAWYDGVYNRATDNAFQPTYNAASVPAGEFTEATRKLHGRKAELLDAFVFAKGTVGEMPFTVRAGRHALVYGETLFFGMNGIAGAQQPIDVVKGLSVPGTQFKELLRPVGQVSGQVQAGANASVGAYYQYRWEKSRLPAAGSYFSTVDFLDEGGERLYTGVDATGRPVALARAHDRHAKDAGQGGVQLKWSPEGLGVDFGFYAARYHDKTPQVVLAPGLHTYSLYYHEGIRTYGASATTTLGEFNFAAEASVRHNAPLSNAGTADLFGLVPAAFGGPAAASDNSGNPVYPVGRTAHLNISMLASLGPSFIAREASLVGEIAWNRVTSITKNASMIDPNARREGTAVRVVYEPSYRQVGSGLDLSVPIGLGYAPAGRSLALGNSFGVQHGGDLSAGLNAVYESAWYLSLNYTHYFGREDTPTVLTHAAQTLPQTGYTYGQAMKDRDFISLSVRRTF
ncbi:DUF1302 family protein [Massilia dura]|uniref:DUF1302 family protein n=1 Tax=Pseudoduganella dura TaxID=321982 RepID=A0A6I3XCT6_9BURK|nr:DUF1302 domain-containing protein [Pseudoduganella dura]MUI11002.1 DUF1302 family protein [Pseudoduganella dura]GGY18433.1 hypothetical protein GCM10007386_54920 [Pseudoduganella dura]